MTCWDSLAYWLDPWPWLVVEVPRRVSIQSRRLSCFYFVLVLGVTIYVSVDFITAEAWHGKALVTSGTITAWRDVPTNEGELGPEHCAQPHMYDLNYSDTFVYRPRSCRPLLGSAAFRKQGSWLHFPTYVEETYSWTYSDCSRTSKEACSSMDFPGDLSESTEVTFFEAEGRCICQMKDSFFAQRPEDEVLVFEHSYFLPRVISDVPFFGLPEWGDTLTIILSPNGTRCEVAGRSTWQEHEAAAGIGAPLRDWLLCAGADLDSDPLSFAPGGQGLAPHFRTMGMQLDFRLSYKSAGAHVEQHHGVVCFITVNVHVAWNSNVEVQRAVTPAVNSSFAERQLYMYGVTPRFSFEGDFRFYSHTPIMTWVVQAAVLFGLPLVIMRYIIEFFIGVPSTIYRRETCRPFDIYDHMRKTQARMLISHAAYNQLTKDESPLDMEKLHDHLKVQYKKEMAEGVLQDHEMDQLWRATVTGFDTDGSGKVSLQEFVKAAALLDDLHMDDITHFLDQDRPVPILERLLDSTRSQLRKKNQHITRVAPDASEGEEKKFGVLEGVQVEHTPSGQRQTVLE
ncbi:unnamed protein product [Effrenium voratum]|uniref:EF-hand domain-containing protein n=1 Tax=Effrenium voratum TaxID=2562239 RepID=A0AA36ISS6_9DINO|nr:unnamed protein product [Effrenium voratum]